MYDKDGFDIIGSEDCCVNIAFQRNEIYEPPVWPEMSGRQQQMLHLDFSMEKDKLHDWVSYAESLGAKKADKQYGEWAVMLDPQGHPFCFDVL